jgi:hypothetical protein
VYSRAINAAIVVVLLYHSPAWAEDSTSVGTPERDLHSDLSGALLDRKIHNVTASRSMRTWYKNTSGADLYMTITLFGYQPKAQILIRDPDNQNERELLRYGDAYFEWSGVATTITAEIPADHSIYFDGTSINSFSWHEMW